MNFKPYFHQVYAAFSPKVFNFVGYEQLVKNDKEHTIMHSV